ncbi:MAG: adenylate/guanylate cyclase domain-containing protein [Muriicola sp.]|nr:adenylate/guanylate cyclase domain-containing protein [Muriicola sp.]
MCLRAQDQNISDSIKNLLESNPTIDSVYLVRLRIVAAEETDPVLARKFSERLITLATKDSLTPFMIDGYLQKGNAEIRLGNLAAALESYFESIAYAVSINDLSTEGKLYTSIAGVYSDIGNEKNAMMYYNKAISILRQTTSDSISLAGTLLNAGEAYFYSKKYDSALLYNQEAGKLFKELNYTLGSAYTQGNTGMVYAALGDNIRAESAMNQAIDILIEMEDYYPISVYLIYMADIYLEKNDINSAKNFVYRSLDLAEQYRLKDQIGQANLKLAEIYDLQDDPGSAYNHYKEYILYRDSVNNIAEVQKMADLRTDYELSQKQIELDLSDQRRINQRNISIATGVGFILIGLLAFGLFRRNQFVRKTKKIIEEEKERSDNLLLNILPEETALELKEHGKVKAKKYESVTVLFTDFKGFTSYSEDLSPEALVETVDFYFSKFDAIIEKYGLEKIKTIGDSYMCVGGLHGEEENHALRMVSAALEIVTFVEETKNDIKAAELSFDIRIGINSGPVVAGVVGTHKFAYDIWGDAVNVAARMETMSEAGKINISEDTYKLIEEEFICTPRGVIAVKNRGEMNMYFVKGSKSSAII